MRAAPLDVVWHQAIGPDRYARSPRSLGEEIEVEFVVAILEEGALAAIAALGHVVRDTGKDNAGEPSHAPEAITASVPSLGVFARVTVNFR